MTLEQIHRQTDTVEGFLTPNEGELLYTLAQQCSGRGAIVEIGSWMGKSTIWLAHGSRAGAGQPVYAIDPHTGTANPEPGATFWTFDTFQANLQQAGVADLVRPMVMTSAAAARELDVPVELLFIDGSHAYEDVLTDFVLWFPRLVEGGVVAFHDAMRWAKWPDVPRFVDRHVLPSRYVRDAAIVDSMVYARRTVAATPADLARNRVVLLWKQGYDAGSQLPLPRPLKKWGERWLKRVAGIRG
ncbi:MAG: class I SAM-dependent methyltransferase [Chloroflexaceae bacterium]|nr:class I SAM-dependent methyltransferase [Chloroflexaceae bacterium]